MLNRRFHLSGVFAVLLALMAQLAMGATVPRIDLDAGAVALCHADDDAGGAPARAPAHPPDCLVCPLCTTSHVQAAVLVFDASVLTPPAVLAALRTQLPPPSTAPPALLRPAIQPRAPPIFS